MRKKFGVEKICGKNLEGEKLGEKIWGPDGRGDAKWSGGI